MLFLKEARFNFIEVRFLISLIIYFTAKNIRYIIFQYGKNKEGSSCKDFLRNDL